MALNRTVHTLKKLLTELQHNLMRAERGNKAASQRVRTGTIKLAKISKLYRKESVAAFKKKGKKR